MIHLMNYDDLKKLYPNKNIELVPKELEKQYIQWGYKTIETCMRPECGKKYEHCFMIEI